MNQMCPNCGYDIHVDDTQVPPYAFTMDCPRCRKAVTMAPPPKPEPTLKGDRTQAIGSIPATPKLSGAFAQAGDPMQMMAQLMAAMMGGAKDSSTAQKGFAWARKHLMICCAENSQRQIIEQSFDSSRYEVTTCQTSSQAIETMHDMKIDLVVLDPQFDAARQGGIAVLRHVSSLMPKYRRKIYVVLVSPQVKTLDTYMAFLNCVNLTVNSEDLESLPAILDKSLKDFNELYRPYHEAGGATPL